LDHLALVERGDQAFHRSRRVPLACQAFAEDGPCNLQRAHNRFLIVNKQNRHLFLPAHLIGRTEADARSMRCNKKCGEMRGLGGLAPNPEQYALGLEPALG
jgi:hypothetical protein